MPSPKAPNAIETAVALMRSQSHEENQRYLRNGPTDLVAELARQINQHSITGRMVADCIYQNTGYTIPVTYASQLAHAATQQSKSLSRRLGLSKV